MGDARRTAPSGPGALARLRVEGDELCAVPRNLPAELFLVGIIGPTARRANRVAAVVGHDEQAVVQQRRRAESVPAVVLNLAVGPRDGAIELQRRHATVAKDDEDMLAVGGRRGRGVGVLAFLAPRYLLEHGGVPENFPALAIEAESAALRGVVRGGGDEDAVAPDDGRGPARAGNGRLPNDVRRGAPMQRKFLLGGNPLTRRAPKARPVFGGQGGSERAQRSNEEESFHRVSGSDPC